MTPKRFCDPDLLTSYQAEPPLLLVAPVETAFVRGGVKQTFLTLVPTAPR
jgi:hypothetical protein